MSVTTAYLYKKFGDPHAERNLGLVYIPEDLVAANPKLPKRIYLNKDLHAPLLKALRNCQVAGVLGEITSFDGAFNIRTVRGGVSTSKHSWAYAVDFNAADNRMGYTQMQLLQMGLRPFTEKFLACFRAAGFTCGGDWVDRPDRMHFEM